jgi:hypothetical protein
MLQDTETPAGEIVRDESGAEPQVPAFLQDIAVSRVGEVMVVHTGSRSYVGRLRKITAAYVSLDADSEELDRPVRLRVETSRVEAVELLPR